MENQEENKILDPLDPKNYTAQTLEQMREKSKEYFKKKDGRFGSVDIMKGIKPIKFNTPEPREIEYQEARITFWTIVKSRLRNPKKKPYLHPGNADTLANILKWWIGDQSSKLDLFKGIYLLGDYGHGKTFIMKSLIAWADFMREKGVTNVRHHFQVNDYKGIIRTMRQNKTFKMPMNPLNDVMMDDLGYDDDREVVIYGDRINLVSDYIYHRHKAFTNNGKYTLFTSNLDMDMIEDQAGQGSRSRLYEMANIIVWDGEQDLRKL